MHEAGQFFDWRQHRKAKFRTNMCKWMFIDSTANIASRSDYCRIAIEVHRVKNDQRSLGKQCVHKFDLAHITYIQMLLNKTIAEKWDQQRTFACFKENVPDQQSSNRRVHCFEWMDTICSQRTNAFGSWTPRLSLSPRHSYYTSTIYIFHCLYSMTKRLEATEFMRIALCSSFVWLHDREFGLYWKELCAQSWDQLFCFTIREC